MVGRPGRSKGCLTCRKRRVKCDQSKPTCFNCLRLDLDCGGYRAVIFINEGVPDTLLREKSQGAIPENCLLTERDSPEQTPLASLPREALLTWFRPLSPPENWTIESFALRTLFRGERHESGSWLPSIVSQTGSDVLASQCFTALAQVAFGRMHRYPPLEASGARTYGNTLMALNARLQDPERACDTDTVASVAILGVYECLSNTGGYGWQQHQFGLANLFRLRGPHAHVGSIERQMLENTRFQMIIASIALRQRTFLADPEWKAIPWAESDKGFFQQLLDFLADIPGMLETVDFIQTHPDSRSQFVESKAVLNRALRLLAESKSWYDAWTQKNPDAVKTRIRDVHHCTLDVLLLPPAPVNAAYQLEFPSLLMANHFTIYHMIRILLNEIIIAISDFEPSLPALRNSVNIQRSILEIDESVNRIIASVPYHLAPPPDQEEKIHLGGAHAPSLGAYLLIAPLRTARFPAADEHRIWLDTVLDHLAETTNIKSSNANDFNKSVVGWRIAENAPWIEKGVRRFARPKGLWASHLLDW